MNDGRLISRRGHVRGLLRFIIMCMAGSSLLSCDPTTWVKIGYPTGPDEEDTKPFVTGIWLGSGGVWYGVLRNFSYYPDRSMTGLEGATIDNVWIDVMNAAEGSSVEIELCYPDGPTILFNGGKTIATDPGHGTFALLGAGDFTPFEYRTADIFGLRVRSGGSTVFESRW